jgi:integrase
VMRAARRRQRRFRLRGRIIVLWRAGLRISEALALTESDLDWAAARSWSRGKGGKRSKTGMDPGRGSS